MVKAQRETQVTSVMKIIERFYSLSTEAFEMRAREHGLTIPQFAVLHAIVEHGPDVPMIEISRATKSPPSSITGIADRLNSMKLIDRIRPPEDRRTVHVTATAAGEAIISTIVDSRKQELDAMLDNMEPGRVDQFIATFTEFLDVLDERLTSNTGEVRSSHSGDSAS